MTAAADRHLLFGLLALQNGLIDQGALVAAFQAWTRDRSRSLADQLVARGDLDADACAGLEAIVALHVKKHGDVEHSLAAVPANHSTRAGLAALGEPEIEASLARVAPTRNGHATEVDDDPDRTATLSVGAATGEGQRFRLLRPHARGGLGEVFVALDAELHREVALKQILERHADDPASRSRFLLEAEITGGLEHPGIVPVYGLGTYGDGRPYYAMRFIKGDSLKEAIDAFHADESLSSDAGRRSLGLRKLLRRFTDVCNAIEYAHSRGVLHRDLKPGNVIVGRHGETLVVDWGLAKPLGRAEPGPAGGERPLTPSSASGNAETLPGSVLGTPAYMSPEQAAGELDRLGPRSDVYSMGATLYCLLTGRPPFEGEDVGAVLRGAQRGEYRSPREVDPAIDPALEAVCLKSMAHRPEDRYPTARALVEDVERWLADEPVSAWREPLVARAVRWARRHRPIVAGATALLVTAVVALSVSTYLIGREQARTRAAYDAEAAQRAEAVAQRRRAEARSRLARRAVDDMYTQVAERWLAEQPRMEPVQREFLEKAQALYGELADEPNSDPALRREAGAAHRRVGDIQSRLGRHDLAEQAYRRALTIAEDLAAGSPAELNYRFDAAQAVFRLGEVLLKAGRLPEAEEAIRRAIDSLADLAHDEPLQPEYRRTQALGLNRMGYLMRLTGRWPDAERAFRRAVELQAALEHEGSATPATLLTRASTLHNFGAALHRMGRRDEAIRHFRKALELYEGLFTGTPGSPHYRSELAGTLQALGYALSEQGETAEAERDFRRAIDLCRRLVDEFPKVPDYRKRLASVYNNLAILLSETRRRSEAEEAYLLAIELAEALAAESPQVPDLRADLIRNVGNFGNFLENSGKAREAETAKRRAIELAERLAADFPKVTDYQVHILALNLYNLADSLPSDGDTAEAERIFGRVLQIVESVPAEATGSMLERLIRGGSLGHLGQFRLKRREFAEGERLLGRALVADRSAAKLAPGQPDPLVSIARHGSFLCQARLALGDVAGANEAAAEAARAAVELARILGDQPGNLIEVARVLARCTPAAADAAARRDYDARAVEALRLAFVKGYNDAEGLIRDPDLAPLTSRPEIRPLLMDVAFPIDPFAP